ncbi:MAG TPA: hypothetical protein VF941_00650 [Clostridia bacterium]
MARRQEFSGKGPQEGLGNERSERPERPERSARFDRPERSERPDKPERQEREKYDRFDKGDKNRPKYQQESSGYSQSRDNSYQTKNTYRDNRDSSYRNGFHSQTSTRNSIKNRADDSIEDIKADITRIEKEIELEIKEIKSLRLGL